MNATETQDPTYCPTCERNVCAIDTFTDDKTNWLCCTACTTALVDEARYAAEESR